MIRRIFPLSIFVIIFGAASSGIAYQAGPATKVIDSLNSALLQVMKNADALRYAGRFEQLAKVIESTHDLDYIAQFAIGKRNWGNLSAEQRQQFLQVFRQYSIGTYAHQFSGYAGETFRTTGEQPGRRGQIQVSSILEIPGEESVDFVYVLLPQHGGLKIVNIIVEGVSDLALKRAEFMSILNDKGFEALIAHLTEKTSEYAHADQ